MQQPDLSHYGRASMKIGEVLTVLRAEFADVSVSKIRFLEAEGLINPQRTPSGYRLYATKDLERLRFILKLQRDSFLPLKVIKERLAAADAGVVSPEQIATASAAPIVVHAASAVQAVPEPAPAPVEPNLDDLRPRHTDVDLTESDLADETGLELSQVRALREFGVLCEHTSNGEKSFDAADLEVASIAREYINLGFEPRHLKTLRRQSEQEADMYAQLVGAVLRSKRPEARDQATDTLSEFAALSRRLRRAYLHQSLRATLDR